MSRCFLLVGQLKSRISVLLVSICQCAALRLLVVSGQHECLQPPLKLADLLAGVPAGPGSSQELSARDLGWGKLQCQQRRL